jgi:serine kinase of HPr protein (carbohydrate metabolism regulator)
MTNLQNIPSLHGNCLWVNETGVLILGDAASGKTELALTMINSGRGTLVADDQVIIEREHKILMARPPEGLQGLMQIHGIGIVNFDKIAPVPLHLIIELVPHMDVPLIPEKSEKEIQGLSLPLVKLAGHEASSADKLWLATNLLKKEMLFNG